MNWAEGIIEDTRKGILPIAMMSGMINVLMLTSPLYMLQIYDRVLLSGELATLLWISVIALIAFTGLGLFDALRSRSLAQLGVWVAQRASVDVMNASLQDATLNGDKSGRHLRDLRQVQNFIGTNAVIPFFDAPFAPFFILMTFILHPYIGILTIIAGAVLFFIAFWTDRRARQASEDVRGTDLQANEVAETFLLGSDYVQGAGMNSQALSRYEQASTAYQNRHVVVQSLLANSTGISKGLRMIFQSASLGVGALLLLNGEMSAGGIIAGSILMARALAPIDQSMNAWRSFQAARNAVESLKALESRTETGEIRLQLPQARGVVKVEHLAFLHTDEKDYLFSDVAFEAEPGRLIGVVGSSGTGKTTLCRILTGIIPPSNGRVSIDDADIHQWDRVQFGQTVGYVPQLPVFFGGTIAQNIAGFEQGEIDEDVVEAARAVGAHKLIVQLPNGYGTLVGPKGHLLSGGQTQLIGLARANFRVPRVLILDEPTAHLDNFGREQFGSFLQRALSKEQTLIVATHDPALVRVCDSIVELKDRTALIKTATQAPTEQSSVSSMSTSQSFSVVKPSGRSS